MNSDFSTGSDNYKIVHMDQVPSGPCPCGTTKRAFLDDEDGIASLHIVDIQADSKTHYHKRMTELYYVLEGTGHMELDGKRYPVRPGSSILIKPGCRHRAVGELKIINVPIPAFDTQDEWFD